MRDSETKHAKSQVSINDESFGMEFSSLMHQNDNTSEKENKIVALESAILKLKGKQKQCIELFYLQQKSYEQISKLTGYSINDVKSNLQNGKRNLKIMLGDTYFNLFITLLWTSNLA